MRPELLQGDSSLEVLQDYALPCPRWLTLGCKCTGTLKQHGGLKTLHISGLEGSVAPLKCHILGQVKELYVLRSCLFPLSRRVNSEE